MEQIYSEDVIEGNTSSVLTMDVSETPIFNFDLADLVDSETLRIAVDDMSLFAFQEVELTSDMVFWIGLYIIFMKVIVY